MTFATLVPTRKDGSLWIATAGGVSRFDGKGVHQPDDGGRRVG